MRSKRAQLALAVAVAGVVGSAALAAAATPSLSTRLYAKAGPVAMHATLTMQSAQPTAPKVGNLSSCTVQPVSKPRAGITQKLVCKNASGQKVSISLAPTAATLTYHLAAASSFDLQSATIQIRHGTDVLFTLTPSTGTVTVPIGQTAALLTGHDTLYVQAGARTYHHLIHQIP
jgi:hypothetical protein